MLRIGLAMLCVSVTMPVWAGGGLTSLYQAARERDALYAAARAALAAGEEEEAIGRANLLPVISASGETSKNNYTLRTTNIPATGYDFTSHIYSLRIAQPLFDMARFAAYSEGETKTALARAVFIESEQDLILRLANAWFHYLLARDTLELAVAQRAAASEQQRSAEKLVEAGAATITDVEESKARKAVAEAQEFAARNSVELRRRELEKIVGPLSPAATLSAVVPKLVMPQPAEQQPWLDAAASQGPLVLRARLAAELAAQQQRRAKAGHWPSLNLVATRQKGRDPSYQIKQDDATEITLQLSVPIFEGGRTTALSRQSLARYQQALHELDATIEDSRIKAAQAYLGVVNGIAQVVAMEQAVRSAEITRQGTEIGQQVGLRTNTDVLNAQQQYYNARRDLQRERYAYLISRLTLQSVSGGVGEHDLAAIDALLMPAAATDRPSQR